MPRCLDYGERTWYAPRMLKDVPEWLFNLDLVWYDGPKGMAGYTTIVDNEGYYWSFHCRPAGKNARLNVAYAESHKFVERTLSKRRGKRASSARAYKFAYGKPRGTLQERKVAQGGPGIGYCMREKKHVVIQKPEQIKTENGRDMIQGVCPNCECKVQKYGKLINCPECGKNREAKADDYICRHCREG